MCFLFFQAEDGIRDYKVTGVQTCALPIYLSLKDVAAWASALDVAQITGPGLFYRLRESEVWLEQVLGQVLGAQVPQAAGGWPVRVVDATVINGPGKKPVQ